MSNGLGKGLADVLQEVEDSQRQKSKDSDEGTSALNVEIPKRLLRDIKLISAHEDITIKNLVAELLKDAVARRKAQVVQALVDGDL